MKIYHFSSLIFQAFKNHAWAKVSNIRQASNGFAFEVTDLLNDQEYICVAYPLKSKRFVCPESADQLLAMTKDKSND